jgi:hypothetical protein
MYEFSSSGGELGSSTMPVADSVRVLSIFCALFFRRRQHKKKRRIPAIATAAKAPTTIPAIAPPDILALLSEPVESLVAVAVAGDGVVEVAPVAVDDLEVLVWVVDADDAAVARNAEVLFVTSNDKMCFVEG